MLTLPTITDFASSANDESIRHSMHHQMDKWVVSESLLECNGIRPLPIKTKQWANCLLRSDSRGGGRRHSIHCVQGFLQCCKQKYPQPS